MEMRETVYGTAPRPALRKSRSFRLGRPALPLDGSRSFKLFLSRQQKKKKRAEREHSYAYKWLNGHSPWFNRGLLALIVSNVCFDVVITVPTVEARYAREFQVFETLSSLFFLCEYVARLVVAGERRKYEGVLGRLAFASTIPALIDLVSFLPWLVEKTYRLCGRNEALPATAFVRIFRVLRILKTERFIGSVDAISRVILMNASILLVGLVMATMLLLVTASLLYYANRDSGDPQFESIPATLYVSILMLTGQGEPDGDLTELTKVLCAFTAIFSVAMVAIPASMLTFGFEIEATRLAKKRRESRLRRRARVDLKDDSIPTSSDSDSDDARLLRRQLRQRKRALLMRKQISQSLRRGDCCPRCGFLCGSSSTSDDDAKVDGTLLRRTPGGSYDDDDDDENVGIVGGISYAEELDSSEEEYEELVLGKSEAEAYDEIKAALLQKKRQEDNDNTAAAAAAVGNNNFFSAAAAGETTSRIIRSP